MIPDGHKYGVYALKCEAKLGASWLQIADNLFALHDPPVELPDHWEKWLGSIEADRVKKCRLFLLATGKSKDPGVLDSDNAWLKDRVHLLYKGLLLTSLGVRVDYGLSFTGANSAGETNVRNTQRIEPISFCPGNPPHFVVTVDQLIHAERVGRRLRSLRGGGGRFGRLWRALGAFDVAVSASDLSMRLHQLVRAIEGVVPIPGRIGERGGLSQRDWFSQKVGAPTFRSDRPSVADSHVRAAWLVLADVAMNTELLKLQAHARFSNPAGIPADFQLSVIGWESAGELVSELPTGLLRRLVILYAQFNSMNAHVSAFGEALKNRDSLPAGSQERQKADHQLASIIDVFNTGIDNTIDRGQEVISELADLALVKETQEQKKEVVDYSARAAQLVADRQARIADFKRRFRPGS